MKSTNKGKRLSYAIVFLLLCMAITSIAVKAPEPERSETENEVPENVISETEVISDVKVEDDEEDEEEITENDVTVNSDEPHEEAPVPEVVSFSKPVFGDVTVQYSMDTPVYSKTMDDYRTHRGVDFKVKDGDDIYAAEKGIVIFAEKDDLMGETVRIKHENNNITVYSGLKSTSDITEGQEIQKGQVIGKAGGSIPVEDADGVHLHFEMIVEGLYENPIEYFNQ